MEPSRRQISGAEAVAEALREGRAIQHVFVSDGELSTPAQQVVALCTARGVPLRRPSARELKRLSVERLPQEVIALEGLSPDASLDQVLASPGLVWLLADIAYPGNAGFAIRTAEVSGAAGIVIDASFDRVGRRQALRKSMRADRLFPVHFAEALETVDQAVAAGRTVIGIEDSGKAAPWEVDLCGSVLLVVGGEAGGIPPEILARCALVVRIPMGGFIPSYNLQAAVAMMAGERLRQTELRRAAT